MSELVYLYDGSFEGLLTAVAVAVKSPRPVHRVFAGRHYVPSLFATTLMVEGDPAQAERILSYLQEISKDAVQLAMQAFLSEDKDAANYLYEFIRLCLSRGAAVLQFHTNDSVRSLLNLSRKVDFEAHRLNGMLRFRILEDGVLYAPFQSDHNVIAHCAGHFQKRLAERTWILHDTGRNFALYWDTNSLQPADIDDELRAYTTHFGELPEHLLTDQERYYQHLWRCFHAAVSNPERENKLLQRSFMPRRYWHFLVEMKGRNRG